METRSDLVARIAAANPLPHGAQFDRATANRVHDTIVAQPRLAARWRPSRRLVTAVVVVALVVIAVPALAVSDGLRSFLGLQPHPVFERSRLLVSAPVESGAVAHLWAAPSSSGGECTFITFGPPGKIEKPSRMTGGGACTLAQSSRTNKSGPLGPLLMVGISKSPVGPFASAGPLIQGYLDSGLGATRVEIRWTGGSQELAYANDHFLGLVQALRQSAPEETRPIRIVAYDAEGRVVRKIAVNPAWFRID
jgi:hypothetical protein